jgi:hypothetical protein
MNDEVGNYEINDDEQQQQQPQLWLSLSQVRTNLIEHDQVLQLTESY